MMSLCCSTIPPPPVETIKQQLRLVSDGETDFSEVKEMIPRITRAKMEDLTTKDALQECCGESLWDKLNEPQSNVLTAILRHTLTLYNESEKKWSDCNWLDSVFPWSGLLNVEVAQDMIAAVPDDRKESLITSKVSLNLMILKKHDFQVFLGDDTVS